MIKVAFALLQHPKYINTSFCKDANGYVLSIEIDRPVEIAGEPYTIVFLKSDDLINWEFLDVNRYVYRKDRYAACPALRFVDDYYYMIYLESFPAYNFVMSYMYVSLIHFKPYL